MAEHIVKAVKVERTYGRGHAAVRVLKGVSLRIAEGEIVSILGASGAGKSTLLHIIGAIDRPTCGSVWYNDIDLAAMGSGALARYRARDVGFVFQFYHLLPDLTAEENVLLPAMMGAGILGYMARRGELRARARELLDSVGLGERVRHVPGKLSGGERARVAIARALINRPKLLLCDEPTGNLDTKTGAQIKKLIWSINRESGTTVVVVTHNPELAAEAGRTVRIVDGVIRDA